VNITIVGPGAMGTLYASLLGRAGHCVALLDEFPERAARLATHGLRLTGVSGSVTTRPLVTADPTALPPADLVIIAVKAYDTAAAARAVAPSLAPHTAVLTLQNGLGNAEAITAAVSPECVILGTTGHGAHLLDAGEVRHAGAGHTVIGRLNRAHDACLHRVAQVLSAAGLETSTTTRLESVLWQKLVVNAAINPLTALLRVRNGELLATPERQRLLDQVVDEAVAVAAAAGIDLLDPLPGPPAAAEPGAATPPSAVHGHVHHVCRSTAANRSSMLQDVLRGRRTEIDAINGAIVARAGEVDVPVPLNQMLCSLVRVLPTPRADT